MPYSQRLVEQLSMNQTTNMITAKRSLFKHETGRGVGPLNPGQHFRIGTHGGPRKSPTITLLRITRVTDREGWSGSERKTWPKRADCALHMTTNR